MIFFATYINNVNKKFFLLIKCLSKFKAKIKVKINFKIFRILRIFLNFQNFKNFHKFSEFSEF
jgi:hypothetical protein